MSQKPSVTAGILLEESSAVVMLRLALSMPRVPQCSQTSTWPRRRDVGIDTGEAPSDRRGGHWRLPSSAWAPRPLDQAPPELMNAAVPGSDYPGIAPDFVGHCRLELQANGLREGRDNTQD